MVETDIKEEEKARQIQKDREIEDVRRIDGKVEDATDAEIKRMRNGSLRPYFQPHFFLPKSNKKRRQHRKLKDAFRRLRFVGRRQLP